LKRILLVTGSPGVGKSTVTWRVVEALRAEQYKVGGMISGEMRTNGTRVGFEIADLASGERGVLAHVSGLKGPQVGRYRVNLEDLDTVGVVSIVSAVENSDVVVVDEIGPMELFSAAFQHAVKRAVESAKLVVGVVHWRARSELIDEVRERPDAALYQVTFGNRGTLHRVILEKATAFLEHRLPR
jgi:nucleoside-triphosphatase